jgi:hypothetical protein
LATGHPLFLASESWKIAHFAGEFHPGRSTECRNTILTIFDRGTCGRREFLRVGGLTLGGLTLRALLHAARDTRARWVTFRYTTPATCRPAHTSCSSCKSCPPAARLTVCTPQTPVFPLEFRRGDGHRMQ